MILRAPRGAAAAFALLEEIEVVLGDQDGLNLSIARQLDARPRGGAAHQAGEVLPGEGGCDLLSHVRKVETIAVGSTVDAYGIRLQTRNRFDFAISSAVSGLSFWA